jgi:hypothetical protein
MKILTTIPGCDIPILDNGDGSYSFTADMMIDGDGTGLSHGDPDYQGTTSYKPDLDADVDPYFVLPPAAILAVVPDVIGCQGLVELLDAEDNVLVAKDAVVGDDGPHFKIGEDSIKLAGEMGVPNSPTTGGDERRRFRYTYWPGRPAVVNGKTYVLQAYRGD